MRAAALVLLAALALVAAGCGGGKSSTITPLELVANAATKTTKADSARVHVAITETVGPLGPLTITADGVTDNATHSAHMTMDLSSVAQLAGGAAGDPSAWKGDVIMDGSNPKAIVEYLRLPALSKLVPGAKPWLKLDLNQLAKAKGVNFSQLLQTAGNEDPTQALQMIQSVGNVQKVGTEQVGGVDTTRYSGTIDPQKVAAKLGASGLGAMLAQVGAKPIPTTVWVDGDGYVRKLDESMSMQAPGAGTIALKLEFTLSDFGTQVDVTAPPADQTTDIAQLLKKK